VEYEGQPPLWLPSRLGLFGFISIYVLAISYIAFFLDLQLFVANIVGHGSRVLHLALPNLHFASDYRLLLNSNPLLGERNADFFGVANLSRGWLLARSSRMFDDELFSSDGNLDVLSFRDHFLSHPYLAT